MKFLLYTVYLLCGLLILWINITLFGFTAGPVNVLPYVSVAASLFLFVVVSAFALFFPRLASCAALVAGVAMSLQPAWIIWNEKDLTGDATLGVPPLIVIIIAAIHLWRTRKQSFFQYATSPHLIVRSCVAAIPLAFFVWFYDAPAVLSLIGLDVTKRTLPVHFIVPDGFRGEIRVDQGVADGSDPRLEDEHYTIQIPSDGRVRLKTFQLGTRKEHTFLSSGGEVPMITPYREEPEKIAMRDLGMIDDEANNLHWTVVYVFGTAKDAEDLLNRYNENFHKHSHHP
jgi:hypothetical protein